MVGLYVMFLKHINQNTTQCDAASKCFV